MLNDDAKLVRRTLNGDASAFGQLYDRYAERVFRLLVRLSADRTQAEDLTQEVFITAYRSLGNWQARGAFPSWLCGIAVRLYRKNCSQNAHLTLEPLHEEWQDAVPDNDPLDHLTRREAEIRIEQAIDALPIFYREVFVLLKVEDMTQKEAAALLEIPLGTVQSRLWRAVCMLRKQLQEQDIITQKNPSLDGRGVELTDGGRQDAVQFRA